MKPLNYDELHDVLKQHDLRVTSQRLCILEALHENTGTHPTIDDIYHLTQKKCPGMAMATVYNNVSDFVSKGLLKELPKEQGRSRYDADLEQHAHFECIHCGELFNIIEAAPEKILDGCEVEEVYYKGRCPKCKDNH